MRTYFKVRFHVWRRCSQKYYAFISLTKPRAAVTSLDLWGIELALTLLFWASKHLLVCCLLMSWRKYVHTHNETSSVIKFLFNCQGWAVKITSEATENVRQVRLLRFKGAVWLKPSWMYLNLLKHSFRRAYWKMVWGFVSFCWTWCELHLEHLKFLDAIFEKKFCTNFTQEQLRWKKRALKLFYQFQTFKQHWDIYIGDLQGNITQFGYNLSTTVDRQAEKQPEWWWEFF